MRIGFHGAARTVTGSRHLLEVNGHRLLLDCGLYQGRRKRTYEVNEHFPFEPESVEAVLLSHAHIDHCGNLPNLVQQGFVGPIYATGATAHLTDILLRDSAHIQEDDAMYLNRKRAGRGEPAVEPLYTSVEAAMAARQLESVAYGRAFEPIPGVRASFVDAGHILGSAGIILDIEEGGRHNRLMFSGDIGRFDTPLLRDPILPRDIDLLIMESTYGDSSHDPPAKAYEELHRCVSRAVERGGKVIVPAFAVGRTQALIYYLHQMIEAGEIPSIPVFVDSPLAINVTAIFREHPECFDEETRAFVASDPHGTAFGFDRLQYTLSVEESKAINRVEGAAVIISASGMAEVGRILHHLKNHIENPDNTVLITSWMAPHTLGRRLVEGEQRVKIFGEVYDVNAHIIRINGFSAHAGQDELVDYALASRNSLRSVFLVHGEPEPAQELRGLLLDAGLKGIHFPEWDEVVEI
jgi:metallo-beta-lactamase family protein